MSRQDLFANEAEVYEFPPIFDNYSDEEIEEEYSSLPIFDTYPDDEIEEKQIHDDVGIEGEHIWGDVNLRDEKSITIFFDNSKQTNTSLADLGQVFKHAGTVAAGNSSHVSDDVLVVFLMDSNIVGQKIGVNILDVFISFAKADFYPTIMGLGRKVAAVHVPATEPFCAITIFILDPSRLCLVHLFYYLVGHLSKPWRTQEWLGGGPKTNQIRGRIFSRGGE